MVFGRWSLLFNKGTNITNGTNDNAIGRQYYCGTSVGLRGIRGTQKLLLNGRCTLCPVRLERRDLTPRLLVDRTLWIALQNCKTSVHVT